MLCENVLLQKEMRSGVDLRNEMRYLVSETDDEMGFGSPGNLW